MLEIDLKFYSESIHTWNGIFLTFVVTKTNLILTFLFRFENCWLCLRKHYFVSWNSSYLLNCENFINFFLLFVTFIDLQSEYGLTEEQVAGENFIFLYVFQNLLEKLFITSKTNFCTKLFICPFTSSPYHPIS